MELVTTFIPSSTNLTLAIAIILIVIILLLFFKTYNLRQELKKRKKIELP